ncbi:MAG TPA: Mur ligase domain-containing protein, partial [Kiritimatiellia bacterium]|nr:Mur ligase domain-containing protein [Kiritimatiellia bacterium]
MTGPMGGHVHVAGVAGVGMSALAQALRWSHDRVTGSDRFHDRGQDLPIFAALRGAGIEIVPQDGSAVDAQTTAVVYSTAIEDQNPDFAAARRAGVPLKHRAAVLAELARGQTLLAVAGELEAGTLALPI